MQFKHAISLLQQRREEIVRQLDRMLTGATSDNHCGYNPDLEKVQDVYKEVNDEIKVLEQL